MSVFQVCARFVTPLRAAVQSRVARNRAHLGHYGSRKSNTGGHRLVTVRLITNPANDIEFQRRAQELAARSDTPEELEQLLRQHFKRARVVRGVTDILERWYVYRDGRWVNSTR